VLFNYPSINKLSQSLTEALETGSLKPTKDQSSEMNALISKYVENLLPRSDVVTPRTNQSDSTNLTVALIGTSGFLGTALLERLLSDARVSKIYGLTRGQASFTTVDSKIEYLRVDYTQPRLGLTEDDFNHLGSQCHMIILNAWKVNFNQTLQSFEDNIRSVKTAVEIVSQKGCNARLVFISSVSAVERYDITEMIPEAILGPEHGDIALSMGYSQSKLVAERILSEAATRCSIPITVLRVGQIAGSTDPNSKQEWPFTDAFPLIVAVAKLIGYLPRLRNIDWIPINNLVEVILELLHDNIVKKQCETYNLVNPRPITWSTLLRPLLNYCGPQSKVISGEEWLEKVKEVDFSGMMIRDLPLASVRETFTLFMHESEKHERKYEMSKALSASPALAKISPISEELLEIWIKQWNF
jgi:thioester reductase-like protein